MNTRTLTERKLRFRNSSSDYPSRLDGHPRYKRDRRQYKHFCCVRCVMSWMRTFRFLTLFQNNAEGQYMILGILGIHMIAIAPHILSNVFNHYVLSLQRVLSCLGIWPKHSYMSFKEDSKRQDLAMSIEH